MYKLRGELLPVFSFADLGGVQLYFRLTFIPGKMFLGLQWSLKNPSLWAAPSCSSLFDTLTPPLLDPCPSPLVSSQCDTFVMLVSPNGFVHHLLVSHSVAETEVECRWPTGWLWSITHWPKRISNMMDVHHTGICNQNLSPVLKLHHWATSAPCVCGDCWLTFSTAGPCIHLQTFTPYNETKSTNML